MDWRRIRGDRRDPSEDGALSDARPLQDRRLDFEERRSPLRGRGVPFVLGAIFVVGTAAWLFAEGGFIELSRLRHQRAELRQEIAERRQRVEGLEKKLTRLEEDPVARERIAREQLGYARPGEVVFLLPRSGGDGAP